MKRTLALILCLVMLVSLTAGCGSKAVPAGPQTELSGGGSAVPEAEPEKEYGMVDDRYFFDNTYIHYSISSS